jgi:hypothetical protein
MLFAAVHWSRLAHSGHSLRRNSLSAIGPKRTSFGPAAMSADAPLRTRPYGSLPWPEGPEDARGTPFSKTPLKPQGAVWLQRGVGLRHAHVHLRCVPTRLAVERTGGRSYCSSNCVVYGALHLTCPLWVISGQTVAAKISRCPLWSKSGQTPVRLECPLSAISGLMHCSKKLLYSITSSARASSDGGTVRPSALAVLRLMTNSNLVGCWTGKSAGLAPLRIRPA